MKRKALALVEKRHACLLHHWTSTFARAGGERVLASDRETLNRDNGMSPMRPRTIVPMVHAALGLRAHSGWAALVAITGSPRAPDVVLRQRIDFLDRSIPGAAQPYHAAAEMEIGEGAELIGKCIAASRLLAAKALKGVIAELRKKTWEPIACGILTASGRVLPDLPAILASHPLIHTAEGVMFREALSYATERNGLAMVHVPEKELFGAAKERLGIGEDALKQHLAELGRRIGPPWRQDEKNATVIAALALAAATR